MATKVKDVSKVEIVKKELAALNSTTLVVGVVGASANYQYDKNATLADVATFNEYGTRHIPARSFLRTSIDKNSKDYELMFRKSVGFLVQPEGALKMINRLSLRAVADVQKNIVDIRTPPNSEATIERKKSSNPLIDTGRLRQSITYQIRKG